MSDRLKDLHRQRALAQEQIAWLDREIAREMAAAGTPAPAPAPMPVVTPAVTLPSPAASVADIDADKIIDQYRSAKPIHHEVKQGCLVYFFAAFALVGLGILLLYLFHHRT